MMKPNDPPTVDPTWDRIVRLERQLEDLSDHFDALKKLTLAVMGEVDSLIASQSTATTLVSERIELSQIASRMKTHADKMGELATQHRASRAVRGRRL